MKKALREMQTLRAAVVRRSHKISPCCIPSSRGRRMAKSLNQLEMVTTFTYRPSLVKIDARSFELSKQFRVIVVTDPQGHKRHLPARCRLDR